MMDFKERKENLKQKLEYLFEDKSKQETSLKEFSNYYNRLFGYSKILEKHIDFLIESKKYKSFMNQKLLENLCIKNKFPFLQKN